jgi:lipopolysaccharide assembly protein A
MRFFLIVALIIAIMAVIFSFQNAMPIMVYLGIWNFEASLALVLLGTLSIGILIGILASFPGTVRRSMEIAKDERNIQQLQADLSGQLEVVSQQQKRIANLEKHLNISDNTSGNTSSNISDNA